MYFVAALIHHTLHNEVVWLLNIILFYVFSDQLNKRLAVFQRFSFANALTTRQLIVIGRIHGSHILQRTFQKNYKRRQALSLSFFLTKLFQHIEKLVVRCRSGGCFCTFLIVLVGILEK